MTISGSVRRLGRAGKGWALLGFGAAVTAAAAVGGLAARDAGQRYGDLQRPPWSPPAWLFGPVWTMLYALIALAGWLVWRRVGRGPALWAWSVQLALNALWTPLFFAAGRYGLAFAELVLMWLAIGVTVDRFRRVSGPATGLLLPYWAWVTFAGALNLAIWRLNR